MVCDTQDLPAKDIVPRLAAALDIFACVTCRGALRLASDHLECRSCGKSFRLLPETGVPVFLPSEDLSYEGAESSRTVKREVQERFAFIDRALPHPYDSFVTYLNLGYVANSSPQFAVRGPRPVTFNSYSSKLLFELIGSLDLSGNTVVEVSAGRGGNLAAIHRQFDCRLLIGLDLAPANVTFSQARHDLGPGFFVVGDAEYLPFADSAVDVILNLESSHYYPHLTKFFDEAYRTIRPGGHLLYGDVLATTVFAELEPYLRHLGFRVARAHDVTENVLLACTAIAKVREAKRHTGLYDTFLVLPGTPEFVALQDGARRYKLFELQKPLAERLPCAPPVSEGAPR